MANSHAFQASFTLSALQPSQALIEPAEEVRLVLAQLLTTLAQQVRRAYCRHVALRPAGVVVAFTAWAHSLSAFSSCLLMLALSARLANEAGLILSLLLHDADELRT